MNKKELDKLIEDRYISVKKHPKLDIWIYNYTPKCQYAANWNNITIQCRGLILDANDNVIANPFPKFFNLGEQGITLESLPDEVPAITEKLSGSLGILYDNNNSPAIATRGSFTSEMAEWGTSWLQEHNFNMSNFSKEFTYLFEIIYPENKVVVDYGDRAELVLLAVRNTKTGTELNHIKEAEQLNITPVKEYNVSLQEAIDMLSDMNGIEQEGFVVHYSNDLRVKLKCEDYIKIHRIVAQFSRKHIIEAMENGNTESFLSALPDELYLEGKDIVSEVKEQRDALLANASSVIASVKNIPLRKEQAKVILQLEYPKIAFALLDGRTEDANRIALGIIKREK